MFLFCAAMLMSMAIGTGDVFAQALLEKRNRAAQDQSLKEEAAFTNSVCDSRIRARIDWDTFPANAATRHKRLYRQCDVALGAIERICRTTSLKETVANRIRIVECKGNVRMRIRLTGSTLHYEFAKNSQGDAAEIVSYLKDRLN